MDKIVDFGRLKTDEKGQYLCTQCGKSSKVVYLDRENKKWICEKCHYSKKQENQPIVMC